MMNKGSRVRKAIGWALFFALNIAIDFSAFSTGPAPLYSHEVHIFYNSKDTIIHQRNAANYPEVSFITFVARTKITYFHYDGSVERVEYTPYSGDENIRFNIRIDTNSTWGSTGPLYFLMRFPYQLVDLSYEGAYLANIGAVIEEPAIDWKGFFYALGYGGISELRGAIFASDDYCGDDVCDGSDSIGMRGNIDVFLDKNEWYQIIGVKTWNYRKRISSLPLKLVPDVSEHIRAVLHGGSNDVIKVRLNVDNVNLVREKISDYERRGGDASDLIPPAGTYYRESPGYFVVDGTISPQTAQGRQYNRLMWIMVDLQNGNLLDHYNGDRPWGALPSGGGPDWLQVAAADICNQLWTTFQCVWKVKAYDIQPTRDGRRRNTFGYVSWESPYQINLDPYYRFMRFNRGVMNGYGFYSKKGREGVVHHESLHCFHMLPGNHVYDEEDPDIRINDQLYVNGTGTRNPYLTFSYDDDSRGFIKPDRSQPHIIDYYERGFVGDHEGNSYSHNQLQGVFLTRFTAGNGPGQLSNAYINFLFAGVSDPHHPHPSAIPQDFPFLREGWSNQIYLKHCNGGIEYLGEDWIALVRENALTENEGKLETDYGYYTPKKFPLQFNGYPHPIPGGLPDSSTCIDYLTQKGSELVVISFISYEDEPFEYDASYFADILRGPRYNVK